MSIQKIINDIKEEVFGTPFILTPGLYKYKGKLILLIDHVYAVNGRVSNWATFFFIQKNGRLGNQSGDYANRTDFKHVTGYRIKVVKQNEY